jgi:predicted enzyme related to lactoylglutathione lyase
VTDPSSCGRPQLGTDQPDARCPATRRRQPGAEFQAGNLTLAVMEPTAFGQEFRPHSLPIALQVQEVTAARTHLEAQGVRFVTDMIDSGVCHQAIFLDPAGNTLGLHHRYAPNPD